MRINLPIRNQGAQRFLDRLKCACRCIVAKGPLDPLPGDSDRIHYGLRVVLHNILEPPGSVCASEH